MLALVIEFSRYWFALLFGTAVAVSFAGMAHTRKNYLAVGTLAIVLFIAQFTSLQLYGMSMTIKLYPFLTHLPVVLFIVFYLKRSWLISVTSMVISFLCCQPPRWIGTITGELFNSASMDHVGYILTVFLMYYLLQKYVVESVTHLMERSKKSCLLFSAIPTFYYLLDYSTTVYTDFLYSGTRAAVQLTPFMTAAFYIIFLLLYYTETQKQANILWERDMLDAQLRQAKTEFSSLRQIQQNTATYRHDMRHHFALLQGMAANGSLEEIKAYLQTVQSDLDAITPIRFCENETVNLVLSSFAAKATALNITLTIDAKLPNTLSLSDTELCSLLSNALENAIHGCEDISDLDHRTITLRIYSKNNKLCMDIRNSYHTEPIFQNGLPMATEQDHGFGSKSMARIVEKHGGIYQFSIKDGWFVFQATL